LAVGLAGSRLAEVPAAGSAFPPLANALAANNGAALDGCQRIPPAGGAPVSVDRSSTAAAVGGVVGAGAAGTTMLVCCTATSAAPPLRQRPAAAWPRPVGYCAALVDRRRSGRHCLGRRRRHRPPMCAIDALGMSAMMDRPITIHSTEPDTGQPIIVTVHHGRATWSPNTTVAVVGATRTNQECRPPDGRTPAGIDPAATIGSAADIGCGVMNFFTDHANAARWLSAHPGGHR
jgi:hypothetical protein